MTRHLRLFLLLLLATPCLHAQQFTSVPGGVAVVRINEIQRPDAYFSGKRVMVIGEPGQWDAFVGLPLSIKPGTHRLEVEAGKVKSVHNFDVADKKYTEQRITLKDQGMVNPSPVNMERINRETAVVNRVKTSWTDTPEVPLQLELPVTAPFSSPYGLRRFFNDQPRNPHSGLDIAAPEGTPIKTAAAGKVVNTGEYYFNGNTVFIEHGQGLITMYCHMSRIDVKAGQQLQHGDIIGLVGKTGRVTGAHLHWGVIMNTVSVDPTLFISVPE
jgi:murein DD-endopeptidase MepM/ murein hydrolase activator NlpD